MIDNFLMIVLRRKFEAVIREMVNALFKSGRSGVLNTAMDFSCAVTDANFQSVSVALGLPAHVGAIELIPKVVAARHGGSLAPGDCFVNNDGYLGNTHCADFTLCVPVFYEGRPRFYAIARAHFADMGFPIPTTYHAAAPDRFHEGLQLPCVRVQRNYADVPEVIDICKANIRAPEQFYGDYLACLAAVRTGEKRLIELCDKHGVDFMENFVSEFQDYAERVAIDAISKLPKGKVTRTIYYDSNLPDYPNGIPITATLTVDPDERYVHFDLTDNVDNVPLGVNMTESTTLASCRMATLNVLGPDIPRCTGAFRRIKIEMREGALVGRPRHPAATSAATSNVCSAFASLCHALFADLSDRHGSAFGSIGMSGASPVVSGRDPRRGGKPFVNQIIMGYWGGPAMHGADGWLTYGSASTQGVIWQTSVELAEQQQPLIIEELGVRVDSVGAGEYQGGPGVKAVIRAHMTPLRMVISAGAHDNPPLGVCGGEAGGATRIWKESASGERVDLGIDIDIVLQPGERLIAEGCGGGGFGDPMKRDRGKVERDLAEGWISRQFASRHYGL